MTRDLHIIPAHDSSPLTPEQAQVHVDSVKASEARRKKILELNAKLAQFVKQRDALEPKTIAGDQAAILQYNLLTVEIRAITIERDDL